MKTILNLIITTFGVLFILSACGGGGADVTIGLEDRTCTNNPFSDDCGDSGTGTRTRIINECLEKGETCKDTTPEVETCLTDLFSAECEAVADTAFVRTTVTIAELRMTFCESNKATDNCQTTPSVMETCTGNPFDSDCGVTYNTNRETACRANNTSACADTITRYCETDAVGTPANLFDTLCATYDTARENACRDTPTGLNCASTITRFCETEAVGSPTNIFNPLCATYNTARETACRGDTAGLDCTSTIVQYCETDAVGTPTNLFNPLCIGVKYNTPREAACRTGNHDSLCGDTITRYCEVDALTNMDNLFDSLCLDNQIAIGVRNAFCMDADDAFTANCIDSGNAEGIMARDNFCKDITDDYANPFTDNCIDSGNAEGITARDEFCKDTDDNYANPFSTKCIDTNNAEAITIRNSYCGDTADGRANAFHMRCLDNIKGIESRRVVNGDCSEGLNAFEAKCTTAVAADLCIRYPFGRMQPGDPRSGDPFKQPAIDLKCDPVKYAIEQAKRYDFCVNDTARPSSSHELGCVEIAEEVCRTPGGEHYNLYARICQLGNYGDHILIFTNCSIGNTYNLQTEACMRVDNGGTNGTAICSKNPFYENADCRVLANQVPGQPLAQENRLLFCRGGNANPADNLDINDPDQVALCVVDGQTSADSRLCRATGTHSNPFSKLCLASGSQFAAERLEFAGYCKNDDTNALAGAVCPDDVTTCLANPFHVDCINEAAYSDFRRPIVNDCETLGAGTSDSRCTATIKRCLANPYHMDCMNNRDYDKVRSDLSAKCVMNGQAAETRCGFITAEVCGTNPFADVCDNSTYAEQQKTLANNCIVNSGLDYCDGEVNDCVTNPFSEPASGFGCKTNAAFVRARQFYCVENPGGVQTISLQVCKDFAKEDGNECVLNPYRAGCDTLFGSRLVGAQQNRRVYCTNRGGSVVIRGDADENARCRGALDANCTGDLAFLTTGIACFGDSAYQDARNTHLAKCQKAMSARAGVECEFTAKKICQSAESIYTNPFLSLCDEGDADSLVARQELILRCQLLDSPTRAAVANKSCQIASAKMILDTCDASPFDTTCDIYSGENQAYYEGRAERVTACGTGRERVINCDGTQARLCVSNTAEAAPLAPACDNVEGITGIRNEFLETCDGGSSNADCTAAFAMNVKMECEADPYDSEVIIAGTSSNTSVVSCLDFDFYNTPRDTRKTACTTMEDTVGCEGTQAMFCTATGVPFNTVLCDPENNIDHARAQRDYCQIRANVGPASGNVVESDCADFLGKRTTATLLRAQATELNAAPTGQTEFLKGTDDGLDTNGYLQKDGADAEVVNINMATAKYDNVLLGGDTADGIAFFAGRPATGTGSDLRVEYYAGILAGADLGEALRQESAGAKVKWHGAVNWAIATLGSKGFAYHDQTAIGTTTRDFVLEIDLDVQEFNAFFGRSGSFTAGQQGFHLSGGYDENTGVITRGEVYFGVASVNEDVNAILRNGAGASYHFNGPLIGIIGAEGALGVFHAQRSNDGQGDALVGGFVAAPPRGDYLSWTRAADSVLTTASVGDGMARFIRGGTTELDIRLASGTPYTLTLADKYSLADGNIVTLGGQGADGVSFAVNVRNGDRLYTGLLSGTDVGAPLTSASVANYQGRIGILIHKVATVDTDAKTTYHIAHDFTLTTDFSAGSFTASTATLAGGMFTLSEGRFNQFGLISGTVNLGASSGTLSGLIGAEGVVGSFISTTHTDGAFAGGFAAHTDITSTTPNLRNAAAWQAGAVRDDGTTPLTVLPNAAAIQGASLVANFYQAGAGAASNVEFGSNPILQTEILTLGRSYISDLGDTNAFGGDVEDGVTFASATVSSVTRHYVGLLSTTSLGNPISNTDATATWFGRYALINASIKGDNVPYISDLVLTVNFRNRTIASPPLAIPFVYLDDGVADVFGISGRYDEHGLIRGTVRYTNTDGAGVETTTLGYVSGLIGQEGAIGAFASATGTDEAKAYAGGFVSVPQDQLSTTTGTVTPLRLKDYTILPNLPNKLTTSGFLKPVSGVATLDVTPANFFLRYDALGPQALDANPNANHIGRRGGVGSTDDDGYHYFHTYNGDDDRGYGYGGILSTTDLGAPLANSGVAAVWTGYFSHYSDITDRNAEFYIDFTAGTVGFANATGDGVEVKTFADNFGGSSDFQLDGQFGSPHSLATGQLGGTVSRIITGPNDSYDILGLIGVEGAVAVFIDFDKNTAGGFTVSNPSRPDYCEVDVGACRVNYADWVNSFATTPAIAPNSPTTENQFLQGTDTTLPTADLTIAGGAVTTLDLDTATFDGVALGGDSADGVGFFQSSHHFAGLLSDTDLGDPLVAGSPKAYWNGQFQTVGALPVNTDFTLEVDFNADISVDRSVGSIEAFVVQQAGVGYYHLTGTYDANGVIKGDVDFGSFRDGLPTMPLGNRISGTLRGLIGAEGAIGAFIADSTGYSGGFVAVPNTVRGADTVAVNYNDWIHSFTTRPSIYLDTDTRVSQFLASHSGATALDRTGSGTVNTGDSGSLNLNTATFKGTAFSEDAADGVSWFWDSTNTLGYAGILSGTDLGAPLSQASGKAKWHGHFQATGGLSRDFLLEIDFDNNPNGIEAFVYHTNANYYHITGSFGANGVITGEVNYGTFSDLTARTPTDSRADNGILTGLIGADGAVGAFISGTGDKNAIASASVNYAGGFVATPTVALDDNVANYDDWLRSFITLPPVVLDSPEVPQFLGTVDGETALLETGTNPGDVQVGRRGTLTLADSFTDVSFDGDEEDGVSFFWDNPAVVGYAGLLAGTDLGAPLTQGGKPAQVRWNGQFQAITRAVSRAFVLTINFANPNTIEAFVQQATDNYYLLTGEFDANGVITGEVHFGTFPNANKDMPTIPAAPPNGFLTGLIGEDGAVGAFVSGVGTRDAVEKITPGLHHSFYAGGFVAMPGVVSIANNVRFSNWVAAFSPRAAPTTSGDGGDFVQGTATDLPIGGRAPSSIRNRGALILTDSLTGVAGSTDTLNGVTLTSGTNHGVGFFRTNNNYFAAGILSGTDLGAPLSDNAQAGAWQGRISAFSNRHTSPAINNKPFTLTVTFDGSGGTVSAFMRDDSPVSLSNSSPFYYKIDGTYDSKGVISGTVIAAKFAGNVASGAITSPIVPIASSAGSLTGLIGERGAVGAFQAYYRNPSNFLAQYGFTGGFVACKRNIGNTACK